MITNNTSVQHITHSYTLTRESDFTKIQISLNPDIYSLIPIITKLFENNNYSHPIVKKYIDPLNIPLDTIKEDTFDRSRIENERYLIHIFICRIFCTPTPNLAIFQNEAEFYRFCEFYKLRYNENMWFKLAYIKATLNVANDYMTKNSEQFIMNYPTADLKMYF